MYTSLVCLTAIVAIVNGHGYLSDPPNRASMWRFNYKTPASYEDNQFFCGGYQTQWEVYKGKCGECGDSYGLPRPRSNENTGKYGRGIVTKNYKVGQEISVTVEITANHKGYFRFSVCKLNSSTELETEECFQNNVLQLANGAGTEFKLPSDNVGPYSVRLRLPAGLTCDRCVLQWHYNTGNSWGVCSDGRGALGCGAQETFRSCSDISISP